MPISQENMNVFWSDLITMGPKWNHFIFMQIDYPRWLPGVITKKSMNTKRTISQEPLVENCRNFMPECFLYEAVLIFEWNCFKFMQIDYPRWPSGAVTKICINTKMTIVREPLLEINPTFCQNVSCM